MAKSKGQRAKGMGRLALAACVVLLLFAGRPAAAQQVKLDRGVRAAGLWCFPLVEHENEWVYMPAGGRLGDDGKGGPEFSFTRYVENTKSGEETASTITEAAGGGILHFLAMYDTPEQTVKDAEKALQEILKDRDLRLTGPLVFSAGRYTIISSVAQVDAQPGQGAGGRKIMATGNAPVLEGQKLALSMDLDRRNAQLLYHSFQMANPDISVVFEMQFAGITPSYDATVDINWSEVMKDESIKAGIGGSYAGIHAGFDVEHGITRMMRNGAIKLTSRGEDASSEALLNTVYSKVIELMFRKVEEPPPPAQQLGLVDALGNMFSSGKGPFGFSLTASYRLIEGEFKGHTVLHFNHQSLVQRSAFLTFNVGPLYKKYGQNPEYFRAVNLADPIYSQREVHVNVDGSLLKDFDRYINSVSVTVKKDHEGGKTTLGELVVDRNTFTEKANKFKMVYGFDGDKDRTKWLAYQYRVKWSFRDGGVLEGDWKTTSSPMVNVVPPYERREITVQGDPEAMKKAGVRSALVRLSYSFFGKPATKQVLVKVGESPAEQRFELIQPKGEYAYQYAVTWYLNGGRQINRPLAPDASGLIFVDEVPPM